MWWSRRGWCVREGWEVECIGVVGLYKMYQREWNGEKGLGNKIFVKKGQIEIKIKIQ